jgi:hypothetical protein
MTIGSVIAATFFLLFLVGAGATYGWADADTIWRWWWAFAIGLIVLVILTVSNPKLAPFTGVVYSLTQGPSSVPSQSSTRTSTTGSSSWR